MNEREFTVPSKNEPSKSDAVLESTKKALTEEEAQIKEKAFFEEDEQVRLRDGKTYYLPPLGLKDARKLIKKLNAIDSGIIIANLIPDDPEGADRYHELIDVLMMGFKPYYSWMTPEHLEEYVDLETAKQIIDAMIGLNGIKKSM
ncbi:DNA polymerase III subunit gamma/tau [Paenibacillus sp. NRS-1780]|uniref:DNA polymerase III subunit gamma/tau n=1 Tax=Paenibacillus sp. NRS-1780 TaxID=3233904 RepID=UPI003D290122